MGAGVVSAGHSVVDKEGACWGLGADEREVTTVGDDW